MGFELFEVKFGEPGTAVIADDRFVFGETGTATGTTFHFDGEFAEGAEGCRSGNVDGSGVFPGKQLVRVLDERLEDSHERIGQLIIQIIFRIDW